jgi:hypothetical protein
VLFRRCGEQALLRCHVLSRAVEELSAGRLALADQVRDLAVLEVEHVAKQQHRALSWRQALEHHQEWETR